ncbi:MAG: aldehyde dehydrogenase family protein, partial [Rhodothermaceae bacterium]|nr:aldehyde dehydrogenase family protein [Rhodothermaceae bacterium]
MNTQTSGHSILDLSCYIAGRKVQTGNWLTVVNPYTGEPAGRVACLNRNHVEQAITAALKSGSALSRYARSEILLKARTLLEERAESFAHQITSESGLCMRESRYEVGRSS